MRPLLMPLTLAATGLSLVAAGVAVFLLGPSATPADVGTVPVTLPVAATAALPSPPAGTGSRTLPARAIPAPTAPVAVLLPGKHHAATVLPVRVDPSGRLDPPGRVSQVGWWRGGAALGSSTGTVVLVGHIDAAGQGLGIFAALRAARPGQAVDVRGADGRNVAYRVTGLRTYSRAHALPASVFAASVAPRLALITCTGEFNRQTRHYADSLVVYAVPA